jgi:hypothetical protein
VRQLGIVIVFIAFLWTGRAATRGDEPAAPKSTDLQVLVDRLADTGNGFHTPEAKDAHRRLVELGTKSFSVLIDNARDERPAYASFQQGTSNITTVGEACLGIVSGQVEEYSYYGKAYPSYLGRMTAAEIETWWERSDGKALIELQIEAVEWSIAEIKKDDAYKSLRPNGLPKLKAALRTLRVKAASKKKVALAADS